MPKRKLVELTLERKKEVLDRLHGGATCRQVAEEFKISKSTVSKISTSRDEILRAWEQNSNSKRKRILRKTDNESVNEKVLHFFFDCRSKNIPVSGPMLQEAALAAARSEGAHEFKASNGWLARFRGRHAIEHRSLSGEAAEIDTSAAEEWLKRVPDVTRGYEAKDIFNADETALFYRQIPKKSLVTKVDKCTGGKLAKERLSVLLCCSAAGEKLKPLVIGHAACPRAFRQHKIQPSHLPVHWFYNKKAWMTSAIFNEWLAGVNKQMRWEGRRILIIVDNAPSHIMTKNLPNVEVKFLPPNLTSAIQPLDQGIIQSVKLYYRKLLLSSLVSNAATCTTVSEYLKKVTVLDAIGWLASAWKEVHLETVRRCFARCGFAEEASVCYGEIEDDDDTETYDYFQERFGLVSPEEYANLDQDVEVHDCGQDTSELHTAREQGSDDERHSEDGSVEDKDAVPHHTAEDAFTAFRTLEEYAYQALPHMASEVLDLKLRFERSLVDNAVKNAVQSKITEFFR